MSKATAELVDQLSEYITVLLEVKEACDASAASMEIVESVAHGCGLWSEEIAAALSAKMGTNLHERLDQVAATHGADAVLDAIRRLIKRDNWEWLGTPLAAWLEAQKKPDTEDELCRSADERGHGNDG